MPEERKIVKLKDEQLMQVSGGKEELFSGGEQGEGSEAAIEETLCVKRPGVIIRWNKSTNICLTPDSNNEKCRKCLKNCYNHDDDPYGGKYDPIWSR